MKIEGMKIEGMKRLPEKMYEWTCYVCGGELNAPNQIKLDLDKELHLHNHKKNGRI